MKFGFCKAWVRPLAGALLLVALLLSLGTRDAAAAAKKRYENWKAVAADMAVEFEEARDRASSLQPIKQA